MAREQLKPTVDAMYDELLSAYSGVMLRPREKLERDIAERMAKGMSREEAIASLYRELRGIPYIERETTPLEKALEDLRSRESEYKGMIMLLGLLLFIAFAVAAFLGRGEVAAAVWFLALLLLVPLGLASGSTTSWEFSEEFTVEGAGAYLEDVARLVPKVFQSLTLQNVSSSLEGDRLVLRMRLEKVVLERGQEGPRPLNIGLGDFMIEAELLRKNGGILVKARYRGKPPIG